ncbi:hypothetical protein KIJ05_07760 [Leuconostoc gelidum subsp. gasicomitatum]|uniref:hypothetical protein n=1 Tax=Leuconostoc gasicomitatum TaxID=115778 RepID=UPI001CC49F25|nr:hypothetical protein [Leuconostoc gasicomitatum]MBZ5985012.1 hypothetical protein [Leuconostoc gasicomitatum]
MDVDTMNSIIDFFSKEDEFYSENSNLDWTSEKNEGFRKGIAYTVEMLNIIKSSTYD